MGTFDNDKEKIKDMEYDPKRGRYIEKMAVNLGLRHIKMEMGINMIIMIKIHLVILNIILLMLNQI